MMCLYCIAGLVKVWRYSM